jgi:hypothetical protein
VTDLPTCWYCPECGDGPAPRGFKHLRGDDAGDTICPGTHVKCVVIPPGTPLPVILDTLGIEYEHFAEQGVPEDIHWSPEWYRVYPATDEAHDA